MQVHYLSETPLSQKAQELVQFDMDSIRQTAAGSHSPAPTLFVANPDQYERNGRLLRDSTSPRLLGYSETDHVLYASDGCNACTHRLAADLKALDKDQRQVFAAGNGVPEGLLEKIAELSR